MPKFMPTLFTALMGDDMAIAVRVFNNANISIDSGVGTNLTFNSEDYDTSSMHSTVSNTDRLVAPASGYYFAWMNVRSAANATGQRIMTILKNDSADVARTRIPGDAATTETHVTCCFVYLDKGDFLTARFFQSSGGALNVEYEAGTSPVFGMTRFS